MLYLIAGRENQPNLSCFLLGCTYIIAVWAKRQSTTPRWFVGHDTPLAGPRTGLLFQFGPFRIEKTKEKSGGHRWAECWLRLLLTFVGAVWLRFGDRLMSDTLIDSTRFKQRFDPLYADVKAYIEQNLLVRFNVPIHRDCVLPPQEQSVGIVREKDVTVLHLSFPARYAQSDAAVDDTKATPVI